MAAVAAGDEQVEAADAVRQALGDQEIEGAVDGGRGGVGAGLPHLFEEVVGLDAVRLATEQRQYFAADRGEAGALLPAAGFGALEQLGFGIGFNHSRSRLGGGDAML
ncbi:hypothetical protein SDC9_208869 [bioreactor metagenome]|uniref:Uncharacterized protein n=1 Tax=bioreactor metagenome TaxID=1076179 RepID=A0A645JBN8_9ZZZZ